MKAYWSKLRTYVNRSLSRQLVFSLMVGMLIPLTIIMSLLFIKARQEMRKQAVVGIQQRAEVIAGNVDELIYNIRGVSDKFAYDVEVEECINKDYSKGVSIQKQLDSYMLRAYFSKTDLLNTNESISALYTKHDEVLNFLTPYLDGAEIKDRMMTLGAKDKESLSMFRWHPLQNNFLQMAKTGDLRQDKVVVGVRRILHPFTGSWMYTQFFTIEEQKLWNLYQDSAREMGGLVYIADQDWNLISAYEEAALEEMTLPREIQEGVKAYSLAQMKSSSSSVAGNEILSDKKLQVTYNQEHYMISSQKLKNADWNVITMVPVHTVTEMVDRLFQEMITVMLLCIVAGIAMITWISHRFLQPVEVLDESMKEVYDGNLEAYVDPQNYHGEMQNMMGYYNSMLVSINHLIEERVKHEKKKKELELEVLMGQINPHFLYNTLENIVWKSNEAGRPDIGRLAASLGRLYRLSIGNGETIVSIQQEIEHVMAYINIQKNRYKERMEFDLSVDYESVWGYGMIKLTLQPVVENCFMYGMEDIDHVLKIRLKVRTYEEVTRFYVIDNGKGLTKDQLLEVRKQIEQGKVRSLEDSRRQKKGTGIGLYSVKERITLYTGYENGVKIQSKVDMGTIVTITVPKISIKDKNER